MAGTDPGTRIRRLLARVVRPQTPATRTTPPPHRTDTARSTAVTRTELDAVTAADLRTEPALTMSITARPAPDAAATAATEPPSSATVDYLLADYLTDAPACAPQLAPRVIAENYAVDAAIRQIHVGAPRHLVDRHWTIDFDDLHCRLHTQPLPIRVRKQYDGTWIVTLTEAVRAAAGRANARFDAELRAAHQHFSVTRTASPDDAAAPTVVPIELTACMHTAPPPPQRGTLEMQLPRLEPGVQLAPGHYLIRSGGLDMEITVVAGDVSSANLTIDTITQYHNRHAFAVGTIRMNPLVDSLRCGHCPTNYALSNEAVVGCEREFSHRSCAFTIGRNDAGISAVINEGSLVVIDAQGALRAANTAFRAAGPVWITRAENRERVAQAIVNDAAELRALLASGDVMMIYIPENTLTAEERRRRFTIPGEEERAARRGEGRVAPAPAPAPQHPSPRAQRRAVAQAAQGGAENIAGAVAAARAVAADGASPVHVQASVAPGTDPMVRAALAAFNIGTAAAAAALTPERHRLDITFTHLPAVATEDADRDGATRAPVTSEDPPGLPLPWDAAEIHAAALRLNDATRADHSNEKTTRGLAALIFLATRLGNDRELGAALQTFRTAYFARFPAYAASKDESATALQRRALSYFGSWQRTQMKAAHKRRDYVDALAMAFDVRDAYGEAMRIATAANDRSETNVHRINLEQMDTVIAKLSALVRNGGRTKLMLELD